MRLAARFTNADPAELFAGDAVRFVHRGQWDLEPFGRLRFRFEGQGSDHVVSLWAVDVKGIEVLLWRTRDKQAGAVEVAVPISFEGNNVFDPGHVVALCLELDEGNVRADQVNRFAGAMVGPVFDRRDVIVSPQGHVAQLAEARQVLAGALKQFSERAEPLRAAAFRPWTRPVVPEEHPLFAGTKPQPVTRQTLGDVLHMTGARSIDERTLDQFHKLHDFGDVCWPHIGICPQRQSFAKEEDYQAALAEFQKRLEDVRAGACICSTSGATCRTTPNTHTRSPRSTTRSSCGSSATASWATTTASRTAATSAAMRTEARPRTARKAGTISSNGTSTSAATA